MSYVSKPTLETYGIDDALEWNLCPDTSRNRHILRAKKLPYTIFEPGVIEVLFVDPEYTEAHHATNHERFKIILSNPKNAWSDYLPFEEIPLDYWETAPAWLIRHRNECLDAIESDVPENKRPIEPTRCRRRRSDGSRCWNWSWPARQADGFCRYHVKFASFNSAEHQQQVQAAARLRLHEMAGAALDSLEDLIINASMPQVRLRASTEVLDRIGVRGGTEVNVSGKVDHELVNPADAVRERLNQLAQRATPAIESSSETEDVEEVEEAEIIEAEVIEDA